MTHAAQCGCNSPCIIPDHKARLDEKKSSPESRMTSYFDSLKHEPWIVESGEDE